MYPPVAAFPWLPFSYYYYYHLDSRNETSPSNDTANQDKNGHSQLWAVWVTLAIAMYIVGAVFFAVWIFTRDFEGRNPPWIPSFFQTEVCCVLIEPIAKIWPAILWPGFLCLLLLYFAADKTMHATTCCGREMTRSRRRKRMDARFRRILPLDDVELVSHTGGTVTPESPVRSLSGITDPIRSPPPMYQSRQNSVYDMLPPSKRRKDPDPLPRTNGGSPCSSRSDSVSDLLLAVKSCPSRCSLASMCQSRQHAVSDMLPPNMRQASRVNSDPLPRTNGGSPSSPRSKSVSDLCSAARSSPRKRSGLSFSVVAESPLSINGCAWDPETQHQTNCTCGHSR